MRCSSHRIFVVFSMTLLVAWVLVVVTHFGRGGGDDGGSGTKRGAGHGRVKNGNPRRLTHPPVDGEDGSSTVAESTTTSSSAGDVPSSAKPREQRQRIPVLAVPTTESPSAAVGEADELPTLSPASETSDSTAKKKDTLASRGTAPAGRHVSGHRKVIEALKLSWSGYKKFAFGYDEYAPISRHASNWGNGRGVGSTIIDAFDTLFLAGLTEEANEAIDWMENKLTFDQPAKLSLFETTIRILGGLLSAYQHTKRPKLLQQAKDLGERLRYGFDTGSGLPDNYVNLQTHHHEGAAWNGGMAILSELGSLHMEFHTLAVEVGDKKYSDLARKAVETVRPFCGGGYCPRMYSAGHPSGSSAGLGSFGDSFYEYLLKMWILTGKKDDMYKDMWQKAAEHTISTSSKVGDHMVPNGQETGNVMEHLACFAGGLFALSYIHTGDQKHLDFAKEIADTCHGMYEATQTKLAADVVHVGAGGFATSEAKYILRPETVETYFYLWRATKDPKYRQWGEAVIDAVDKHLRIDGAGYAGTVDVNSVPVRHNDNQETFWMAETLKYLLLLFSEDELLDLKKWVINTEAHPLRVQKDMSVGTQPRDAGDDSNDAALVDVPAETPAASSAASANSDDTTAPPRRDKGGKKHKKQRQGDDEAANVDETKEVRRKLPRRGQGNKRRKIRVD